MPRAVSLSLSKAGLHLKIYTGFDKLSLTLLSLMILPSGSNLIQLDLQSVVDNISRV